MKMLLYSLLICLALAEAVASEVTNTPPRPHGIVYVVGVDSLTAQTCPDPNGERTTTPLLDNFPAQCTTTCDAGTRTEYCDFEEEHCIELSDNAISVIRTNVSVRSFAIDRNPWRFQKLGRKYAILYADSSYQVFDMDSLQLGPIRYGSDGAIDSILLTSEGYLYHVELVSGIIFVYDVFYATESYIFRTCAGSYSLHSIDSSTGEFFWSCQTAAGEREYLLYTVNSGDVYTHLDLCGDPISFPDSYTFATTCSHTLTVYTKGDSTHNQTTRVFETSIVSRFYLSNSTILVDMGDRQHIVNVDLFIASSGSDGIVTLNSTTNCSLIQKLVGPELYATVCADGDMFNVLLFNTRSGDQYLSVNNITIEPLGVYYQNIELQVPLPSETIVPTASSSSPPSQTVSPTPPPDTVHSGYSFTSRPPVAGNTFTSAPPVATPSMSPVPSTVVDTPPGPVSNSLVILIVIVTLLITAFILIALLFILFGRVSIKKFKERRCRFPVQESIKTTNQLSMSPCFRP